MYCLLRYNVKHQMNVLGECACVFLLCMDVFRTKNLNTSHVLNLPFIIVISKFISVDEMKELVIVKNLSYSDVTNMFQEKNPHTKGISEKSVRRLRTSNNIRK